GLDLWVDCSDLFHDALSMNADILSGTPLERAVLWSVATTSNRLGYLQLTGSKTVKFKCDRVDKARIFPGSSIVFDEDVRGNIAKLKPETLYYADDHEKMKKGGETSHPLGDIFFLTRDRKLVLIDTTAQTYRQMTPKRKHMQQFADLWKNGKFDGLPCDDLMLVIINPLELKERSRTASTCPQLQYVFGEEAVELLGGLAQCMAWY
ncbi:MAG: hypothetical protein SGILL_006095, partial [Bacillariaceae sp.]